MTRKYDLILNTNEVIDVDGTYVEYGRLPSGLVAGFKGIVFHFKTTTAYSDTLHKETIKPLIDELLKTSHGGGSYWELTKERVIVWEENSQVTLVSFKLKKAAIV